MLMWLTISVQARKARPVIRIRIRRRVVRVEIEQSVVRVRVPVPTAVQDNKEQSCTAAQATYPFISDLLCSSESIYIHCSLLCLRREGDFPCTPSGNRPKRPPCKKGATRNTNTYTTKSRTRRNRTVRGTSSSSSSHRSTGHMCHFGCSHHLRYNCCNHFRLYIQEVLCTKDWKHRI